MNGNFFLAAPSGPVDFKELFKFLVRHGVGRPVDADGYAEGPWTPELLTQAISDVDGNQSSIDLRTVQLWFQDNDRGISADSIFWLARIAGSGDADSVNEWRTALTAANQLLAKRRRQRRQEAAKTLAEKSVSNAPLATPEISPQIPQYANSRRHFNLSTFTDRLFTNKNNMSVPIIIFAIASSLAIASFALSIHNIVYEPTGGVARQIGYLWAPNWTVTFLLLLPWFLAVLITYQSDWLSQSRPKLLSKHSISANTTPWIQRVAAASYIFWGIFFVTIVIASGVNWTTTHLLPILKGDPNNLVIDWGRIAILHPELISPPSAILFSGAVFLFNGVAAYLFFAALIFLQVLKDDHLEIVAATKVQNGSIDPSEFETIAEPLIRCIFVCSALGALITIMMKLQSSFLQSGGTDILEWLILDFLTVIQQKSLSFSANALTDTAPGTYISFFSLLPIVANFLISNIQLRSAVKSEDTCSSFNRRWTIMNVAVVSLFASYFLIGIVTGFSVILAASIVLSFYILLKPECQLLIPQKKASRASN